MGGTEKRTVAGQDVQTHSAGRRTAEGETARMDTGLQGIQGQPPQHGRCLETVAPTDAGLRREGTLGRDSEKGIGTTGTGQMGNPIGGRKCAQRHARADNLAQGDDPARGTNALLEGCRLHGRPCTEGCGLEMHLHGAGCEYAVCK